ncbi:MAG TPA: DUF1566 domain-containing protein [Polyangiaceae bacterium]|nr:DUF1566 domain-containing protein [Polyangiaceae bacterium]
MIFIRSGIAHGSFVAIFLCLGCSSSDSGVPMPGAAGHGGDLGAGAGGQSGNVGGQSGDLGGQGGDAGNESAGASGDAGAGGAKDDEPGTSHAGSSTGGASAGSGGQASGGSATNGGSPGLRDCVWEAASVEKCPACEDDGDCAEPGYKYVGSGAVTSSCCGFEWQEETAPGTYSWEEAGKYCASLSLSGRGWRLPKIAELFSIVDLGDRANSSPAIDVEVFSDTLSELYWSSSLEGDSEQAAWTVNFADGASQSTAIDDTHPHRVRCVR